MNAKQSEYPKLTVSSFGIQICKFENLNVTLKGKVCFQVNIDESLAKTARPKSASFDVCVYSAEAKFVYSKRQEFIVAFKFHFKLN